MSNDQLAVFRKCASLALVSANQGNPFISKSEAMRHINEFRKLERAKIKARFEWFDVNQYLVGGA